MCVNHSLISVISVITALKCEVCSEEITDDSAGLSLILSSSVLAAAPCDRSSDSHQANEDNDGFSRKLISHGVLF